MNAENEPRLNTLDNTQSEWDKDLAKSICVPPVTVADRKYTWRDLTTSGMLLGAMAGCTSLLLNVTGSVAWPAFTGELQHPLRLIQIYLTFPLGETAFHLDGGLTLAVGSALYLITGMLYGVLFEFLYSTYFPGAHLGARLLISSILMLVVWIVNFYAVLSWLQPLLFGGRWVVDLVPSWVAAATHLVFGWTIAALYTTR